MRDGLAVPALLLLGLAALVLPCRAASEGEVPEVPVAEAGRHVGEVARVCGQVASAAHFASVGGRPTFLNLGKPYPDQLFTVVIWGGSRSRFETPPERLYDGKAICVTGTIETYKGKPQIVVDDPSQIETAEEQDGAVPGGDLGELERVLVKALLSSLGCEANYGSGEWDQEAVEAAIAFQEASGLPPSGAPDAETLRAIAGRVGDIPERDRTMVIRLILLELARRQE